MRGRVAGRASTGPAHRKRRTVDIDGVLGNHASQRSLHKQWTSRSSQVHDIPCTTLLTWEEQRSGQEVQEQNVSLKLTHKHRMHRRLYISAVEIPSFLCAEKKMQIYLFFWPAISHSSVRPVTDHKYIFICTHLIKEWWVCNGTADECDEGLHLRFWFLRTERDLRGSQWWQWCAADSLSLSFSSVSISYRMCAVYNEVFRGQWENPNKLDERVPTLTQHRALENKTGYTHATRLMF